MLGLKVCVLGIEVAFSFGWVRVKRFVGDRNGESGDFFLVEVICCRIEVFMLDFTGF